MSRIRIEGNPVGHHRYELEAWMPGGDSADVTISQHWLMQDGTTWEKGDSVTFHQMAPASVKRLGEFLRGQDE
jgi:hypothetical protein